VRLQDDNLAELRDALGHLPTTLVRRYQTDLQGIPALERLAADSVPDDAFAPAPVLENETYAKLADGYALTLRTPFAAKDEIDLFESASELTIRIGNFKRKVMLPDVLRRQRVTSARCDGETLVIHFSGKESEHEA